MKVKDLILIFRTPVTLVTKSSSMTSMATEYSMSKPP
jgi:hypothetical protein